MVTPTQAEYVLGKTLAEHDRLNRQGRLISKLTQHFLEQIGLAAGMRVLDIGSGLGDVALLAAGLVGGSGQVVGIDSDTTALEVAKARARQQGLSNVLFHACDIHRYDVPDDYDAVIGRCVLLHQREPLATLRAAIKHVRRGGIVAFQEPWFSRAFSCPEAPLFQEMLGWLHDTVLASGLDADIGIRLPSLYASSGLPRPELAFEMLVHSSPESEVYDFCVDTVRSLLPIIESRGISTVQQIQVDSLAKRLRSEASALVTVVGVMPLVGAWTKRS
jgi:SAM-dependent methyltransferase